MPIKVVVSHIAVFSAAAVIQRSPEMSMDSRKRPSVSSNSGSFAVWPSSFRRQPARVLIVEALPPWWTETSTVLCDALDNFFALACSLDGPCRIPLLSLYALSRQQECLLPFVQVRGNLARLHSCVEELRSIPGEGCIRGAARGGELLRQAVLDSLQQFKQYIRHTSTGNQANNNTSVEVTVVTGQPGQGIVRQLEMGLKDADLVSLKRLLVVQTYSGGDWGQDTPSPEAALYTETDVPNDINELFIINAQHGHTDSVRYHAVNRDMDVRGEFRRQTFISASVMFMHTVVKFWVDITVLHHPP
ncbi:hypothetical protein F2P81_009604 [Scophthalmus maximus]|uniref:Meiosis 1 arrest protein n=1 Tax=Scophthalmus maximus TaxID=52904 RepID=A0A6A4T559_SCOMX|nr:hypothetical protein F2P81_009604 [Scophthalmus maximus]